MPSFVLIMGDAVDALGESEDPQKAFDRMKRIALIMTLFGVGIFILSTLQFIALMTFAYKVTAKIRIAYLRAILT